MSATLARKTKKDEVGFQLAPMIDMTFLLLIFFMVTTKITSEQKKLEIKLPTASAARSPEDLSNRDIINVDGDGRLFAGERPVNIDELKAHLRQRFKAVPPLKVYIRADAGADIEVIKKVMAACAEAGAIEVLFGSYNR